MALSRRADEAHTGQVRLRAILLSVLCLMSGCGDDGSGSDRGGDTAANLRYALLRNEEWQLQEAVDPPADDPASLIERPVFDWYIEYVRSPSELESELVRVSGHATGFEESRSQLSEGGFDLTETSVDGWRAVGGTFDEPAGIGPALLLLENGDRSIVVLSYEVALDELAVLAARIEPVDAAAWTAAGGVIR